MLNLAAIHMSVHHVAGDAAWVTFGGKFPMATSVADVARKQEIPPVQRITYRSPNLVTSYRDPQINLQIGSPTNVALPSRPRPHLQAFGRDASRRSGE